jgi:hypothetical protein
VAHGTAFSTTSSQDGCRLVTRKRACVASVVGVLPALYAHRLGRAYGPDSSPGDDTSACTAYASSTSSSLAHWLQTFEPAGSASRPARSTTPRSLRRSCRFASTPSRATLHTSCAKRSAVHSKRRHSPPEPPAHADAQPLLLTFRNRREVRDAVRLRVPGATRRAAFARASPSIGVSVSVGPASLVKGPEFHLASHDLDAGAAAVVVAVPRIVNRSFRTLRFAGCSRRRPDRSSVNERAGPAASILSFSPNATDSAKAPRGGEWKPLVATAGPVH